MADKQANRQTKTMKQHFILSVFALARNTSWRSKCFFRKKAPTCTHIHFHYFSHFVSTLQWIQSDRNCQTWPSLGEKNRQSHENKFQCGKKKYKERNSIDDPSRLVISWRARHIWGVGHDHQVRSGRGLGTGWVVGPKQSRVGCAGNLVREFWCTDHKIGQPAFAPFA